MMNEVKNEESSSEAASVPDVVMHAVRQIVKNAWSKTDSADEMLDLIMAEIGEGGCIDSRFTLIEIKAFLRSKFLKQLGFDSPNETNRALAIAYNILEDDKYGIKEFCLKGKAIGLKMDDFEHARI